jgi:sugar lactone lactonase YvrE
VATNRGIGRFDLDNLRFDLFRQTAPDWPHNRYNDGKCDRAGRFWTGTMGLTGASGQDKLYRFDPGHGLAAADAGFSLCNGMGWSPDNSRFYLVDSRARRIYVYDFDLANGTIENRRVFAEIPEQLGVPDGLTVDAEACVWVAIYGGWRLTRYDPAGRVERVLMLPVPLVTSCAFGGSDLRTLYVTSARRGLSPRALAKAPLSGSLLALESGVPGLAEPVFAD